MQHLLTDNANRVPWNKGKITGQKPSLNQFIHSPESFDNVQSGILKYRQKNQCESTK
jgi:hypothetical protein